MPEKRVLIVDDEQRMADSLRDLLRDAGYEARTAYSGREAIAALEQQPAHVVVTDLRMQDIDGLELLRHLHDHHPRALTIVITGHATMDSAIQAVHYQVFDYLRKPFEFELFRMAIEKAFQKIETEQLREDTAAMITHDIKIPLTSIIGFASMIVDPESGEFHPRAAQFCETIQANGNKILELIENYLTSCKIEAGTLKIMPAPVAIADLVNEVARVEGLEASRHDERIDIRHVGELPDVIRLDEPLIYRALSNLVQNAVKYSDDGATITIETAMLDGADSPLDRPTLQLCVSNRTDQLAPDQLDCIYDRFRRGASHERIEGAGIGLYVVSAVARAHQGSVNAELTDDGVARFSIFLPTDLTTGALE